MPPKRLDEAGIELDDPPGAENTREVPKGSKGANDSGTATQRPNFERLPSPTEAVAAVGPLTLGEVLASTEDAYPILEIALYELDRLEGKTLEATGKFDTKLAGNTMNYPLGFYQYYRGGMGVYQPLFRGGSVYGGYKVGVGDFPSWYGYQQTNDGGEFRGGFNLPVMQGRPIDERRRKLFTASLDRAQQEPVIETQLIAITASAAETYWMWVAAGRMIQIEEQLLDLAERRVQQIDARVREGDLPNVERLNNGRFIASRRSSVVKAVRKLEMVSYKLSLFLRDAEGNPVVPPRERLPSSWPTPSKIDAQQLENDVLAALAARPEFTELQLEREKLEVDLRYAQNLVLPKLDAVLEAAKDVGGPTPKDDKSPFQLEAGLVAEVPLQRRIALGKVAANEAKLRQVRVKQEFLSDKVRVQVQDAVSAVNRAVERIEQETENLRLSQESMEVGERLFAAGDINTIELNIYETAAAAAGLLLVDAQLDYHLAITAYRAARAESQGLEPLRQMGDDAPQEE